MTIESPQSTAAPEHVPAARALRGWRRGVFLCRVAVLTFLVRRRMPARPAVALYRRVYRLLEDSTLLPENRALVPHGVRTRGDLRYGTRPEETLDVFRPDDDRTNLPIVFWVHGGGWISGSKADLHPYLQTLAARGFLVIAVEYTLAPELRYPGQIEQTARALRWILDRADEHGGDPQRVFLAGDSAGASISGQLARALADPAYRARVDVRLPEIPAGAIRGAVLTSGAFLLTNVGGEDGLGRIGDLMIRAYTGTRRYIDDPRVRCASLAQDMDASFPPTFLTAGNDDPLRADSAALAAALSTSGVRVETAFFPEDHEPALPHGYCCDLRRPEARATVDRIVAFLHRESTSTEAAS